MDKTRFLGCCQICEREQKLTPAMLLVHHGFQRPGFGEIVGDCAGVAHPPYERSCEFLKVYLGHTRKDLAGARDYLAKLQAHEVTYLIEMQRDYSRDRPKLVQFALGVTELWTWTDAYKRAEQKTAYQIKQLVAEIERLEKRIAAWVLAEIRTITEGEAEARTKAQREERAAERHKAKKERQDRAAELEKKRGEREVKRQKVLADFAEKFQALAAKGTEGEAEARAIAHEMARAKYQTFGYVAHFELSCREALVTLGLAEKVGERYVIKPA